MRIARRSAVALLVAAACGSDAPPSYEPGEELSGGERGTVVDATRQAMSRPIAGLDDDGKASFDLGAALFNRTWVTAPSSTESIDGLGPTFNAISCSSCHFLGGRGRPPRAPGEKMISALVRLSVPGVDAHGGPVGEPTYGDQLNPSGIVGVPGEGTAVLTWEETRAQYGDGTWYQLRRPVITFTGLAFGPMAADVVTSLRVAPTTAGLGLLELVPEADILALADPDDADGDGVSGRPNLVRDVEAGATRLGRLGWKASQPSMRQESAAAFLGDIGITSPVFPAQNCPPAQTACAAAPDGKGAGPAELDEATLQRITYHGLTLAVPARRRVQDPQVLAGKQLFTDAGCAACHTPVLRTGSAGAVPELADQTIRPFTDLLLHDMGDGLADGRPDYLADGREWRTPPLWGIGLSQIVNGHTLFLHDGRARNLSEAILWHGGEGEAAKEAFRTMPERERKALIAFLESL